MPTTEVEIPQQLYTVAEAAPMLKVSERHLYVLVSKRLVPHHKPTNGRGIRFTAKDINEIIENGYRPVVAR